MLYKNVQCSRTNPPHFEGDPAPIFYFDVGTARPDFLFNADRIRIKLPKIMRIYADPYPDTHIYFQFLLIFSSFLFVDILISQKIIVP